MDIEADVGVELRVGEARFGPRDAALLRAIESAGSLNAAADSLGRSYSRTHARVNELEDAIGPLVERERGGSGGGGSELTETARDLLARFRRLETVLGGTAETTETVIEGRVLEREGELATIGTDAGRIQAVLRDPGERVQVSLRADAITLHEPASAPPEADTSARNRIEGVVEGIDRGEAIATVAIDAGFDPPVVALLTLSSVDRLGLEPGSEVVASFKATATRATPREGVE